MKLNLFCLGRFYVAIGLIATFLTPQGVVAAGDSSTATLTISGIVPTYFSVTTSGTVGDLDLTPKVSVSNRSIALIHFKYNENVQSIDVSSNTASGVPEDSGGNPYQFGGGAGFKVAFKAGCQSVDPTYNTPFAISNVAVDVKSALSAALVTNGIEEDCELTVSYTGTTVNLPLAGRYSIDVIITMTAQ